MVRGLIGVAVCVFAICSGSRIAAQIPQRQDNTGNNTLESDASRSETSAAQQTPRPQDIVSIWVERIALAPRDKHDVTLIREDKTKTFEYLARALVERGFFDLQSDYNKDQYAPDMDTMRITVHYGKSSEGKIVTRWMPNEFDDAWGFEMLIRGAATRYAEEVKARRPIER